ncbi:ATP-binding protein [Shewanella sp. MBTL60-007]|uniref:ATP-binding protein n=1 Tax=Shewanella sp. MBTL60-007 TaxID=2815911 RepID=UPI001BC677A0|nr:ATP-binding protein [Shewanella sp. MBTL60-007]GIU19422.1 ATPase [Shewanella sp. MBTL60-007]
MPEHIDLSPNPKSHIKTLSRIGYNLDSAISDIIDNSVTAESKNIFVEMDVVDQKAALVIKDDGYGMDEDTLINSMRIGCKDPSDIRGEFDLGRFGSGMKMASFSQARKLTVISKIENFNIQSATWDLDLVERENAWTLIKHTEQETKGLCSKFNIEFGESGTAVIWENISKYNGYPIAELQAILGQDLVSLKSYVRLHFHKFMEGKRAINFYFNFQKLDHFDPFLRNRNGYQEGPSQKFRVKKGGSIELRVHILPHESKLTKVDLDNLGGTDQITANQGLYVYRANRLIISGGWFGLTRLSQLGKLARVEVNVPTSLDEEWSTDVKKSSLEIPHKVKVKLKQLIREPIKRSQKTYRYRGRLEEANAFWKVNENEREKSISYEISKDKTLLKKLIVTLDKDKVYDLIGYLTHLSVEIPIHHIYEKMSSEPNKINQNDISYDDLLKGFKELWNK